MLLLLLGWFVLWHLTAYATQVYTATFDDLSEGTASTTLSDGGLTFSTLDTRVPGSNPPGIFVVDTATATLPAPFSSPNALTFGGYVPGPSSAFGRMGSCWIDFSGVGTSASLDVFGFGLGTTAGNALSLEAWNGTTLVASDSGSLTVAPGVQSFSLTLNDIAPFNRLELVSSGSVQSGVSVIMIDNVSVTVPEPKVLLFLPLALVAGLCIRQRAMRRMCRS